MAADPSAVFDGRWLVDDNLMPYWLRTDGCLVRAAPEDDDALYIGTQYAFREAHYWLTAAGDCYLTSGESRQQVPRIPETATPLAMVFKDRHGVNHIVTQKGWFVLHDNGPVAEPAFRANLNLI